MSSIGTKMNKKYRRKVRYSDQPVDWVSGIILLILVCVGILFGPEAWVN